MNRDDIPPDRGLAVAMIWTMGLLGLLYLVGSVIGVAALAGVMVAWMGRFAGPVVTVIILIGFVQVVRRGRRAIAPGDETSRQSQPELYAIVERLCASLDVAPPRINIVPTDAPNALAVGLPKRTVLCVTRGLLARLGPEELEVAIAHELSHVAHRDAAVMTIACSVGVIGEHIAVTGRRSVAKAAAGRRARRRLSDLRRLVITAVVAAGPIGFGWSLYALSVLLTRRLSRYRELAADRAAAYLTGRPSALASALMKCSDDAARIPMADLRAPRTINELCLMPTPERDFRRHPAHPPLRERIDRLAEISRRLDG